MVYDPVATYLQEADDLLVEVETAALALIGGEPDPELVNRLFRAFHTIKGSGAMCGFQQVADFTHHLETVLDQVRSGARMPAENLASLVLAAKDEIKALLAGGDNHRPDAALLERLVDFKFEDRDSGPAAAPDVRQGWSILFRPDSALMTSGGNPNLVLRDLRKLGDCKIVAHTNNIPPLEEFQPGACYLWWTASLQTTAGSDAIRDVFLFVEDGSTLQIEPEIAGAPVTAAVVPVAAAQPAAVRVEQRQSSVRVPSARLDRLVGLVGEMVVTQSRINAASERLGASDLAAPAEEMERLISELRDEVLSVRMMPIETIFGRFRRLVHDMAPQLGKQIDLQMQGGETELDKSILDQLGEPLIHMLRNSMDHGIESPDQRECEGKPPCGVIRLMAMHLGSEVLITVSDDGHGIDRAIVRAKAIERELIAPDANLTDKELLNLILLPGFSTAKAVTAVSGRGVGMDVVKRQVEALRGTMSVSSELGKGTRIELRLPLTLAIIEGLLLQVGSDRFIVPMAAVLETVELAGEQRSGRNGRNVIAVRGQLIPYVDLRQTFAMGGAPPPIEKIIIVQYDDQRVGLLVDRVIGTHQTVIQPLGRFLHAVDVISGSTVMGDGRVALILDVHAIVQYAEKH